MNTYITFGGSAYDDTTALAFDRAPRMGADRVFVYDDKWLMEHPFYQQNHWLWDHHGDMNNNKRGFGWFAWKPLIIMDALTRTYDDGDMVLYVDADTFPIADFSVLFRECRKNGGMMLFTAEGCAHRHWCKRDCFVVMGQDEDRWRIDTQHAVARFMVFERGPWAVKQFLMEWLTYCVNPLATTFDPSVILPEHPQLHEHRTEQAIFTNLAHRYGQRLYREACQFGNSVERDKDLYPQLFEQRGTQRPKTLEGSKYRNIYERSV